MTEELIQTHRKETEYTRRKAERYLKFGPTNDKEPPDAQGLQRNNTKMLRQLLLAYGIKRRNEITGQEKKKKEMLEAIRSSERYQEDNKVTNSHQVKTLNNFPKPESIYYDGDPAPPINYRPTADKSKRKPKKKTTPEPEAPEVASELNQTDPRWQKIEKRLQKIPGAEIEEVVADGNCQFACFAYYQYNDRSMWKEARKEIVDYMKSQPTRQIIPHMTWAGLVNDKAGGSNAGNLTIAKMSKDGTWGNEATILAACELWQTKIVIILPNKPYFSETYPKDNIKANKVWVLALVENKHYKVVNVPEQIAKNLLFLSDPNAEYKPKAKKTTEPQ